MSDRATAVLDRFPQHLAATDPGKRIGAVVGAVSADLEGRTGVYCNGQTEAKADSQAYDAAARQKLKALSLELVGLKKAAPAG